MFALRVYGKFLGTSLPTLMIRSLINCDQGRDYKQYKVINCTRSSLTAHDFNLNWLCVFPLNLSIVIQGIYYHAARSI